MKKNKWRPKPDRGELEHANNIFGRSRLENNLEVFLPEEPCKQKGMIIAGQHGDEADGTHLLSRALRLLKPGVLKCAVILAANPDGILRGTRGNAAGVDLNRNFPTSCWEKTVVRHKWSPEGEQDVHLSTGEMAGSEPETTALISLVKMVKPAWIISIHSPLACVDDPSASPLGKWLSEKTRLSLVNSIGYSTPGSFGQWCLEQKQQLITLELPDSYYHTDQTLILTALLNLLSNGYQPENGKGQ